MTRAVRCVWESLLVDSAGLFQRVIIEHFSWAGFVDMLIRNMLVNGFRSGSKSDVQLHAGCTGCTGQRAGCTGPAKSATSAKDAPCKPSSFQVRFLTEAISALVYPASRP